jgi:hypothetical protein
MTEPRAFLLQTRLVFHYHKTAITLQNCYELLQLQQLLTDTVVLPAESSFQFDLHLRRHFSRSLWLCNHTWHRSCTLCLACWNRRFPFGVFARNEEPWSIPVSSGYPFLDKRPDINITYSFLKRICIFLIQHICYKDGYVFNHFFSLFANSEWAMFLNAKKLWICIEHMHCQFPNLNCIHFFLQLHNNS